VLGKTGTLTEGQLHLTDVLLVTSGPWTPGHGNDLLRLVAPAEHGSEHPLAAAIVQAATERGLTEAAAERLAAVTGTAMTAWVDGWEVLVANGALLSDQPIDAGTVVERASELVAAGTRPM
jgi:Cu+-exporting ATPase